MKRNKTNVEHYTWGNNCDGWHLLKSNDLSIIQEVIPPNSGESEHYHNFAQQFFFILKGTASFEISGEAIQVEANNGIYIKAQTKHLIKNNYKEDLEFILISNPSTRGDRYDFPYQEKETTYNLDGKNFKGVKNSNNGEVSSETIFEYRQENNIIWATYKGGDIRFGTLSGQIENDKLVFNYQHQNVNGQFKTGQCNTTIVKSDDIIILKEEWKWTCDDFSSGYSELAEIV